MLVLVLEKAKEADGDERGDCEANEHLGRPRGVDPRINESDWFGVHGVFGLLPS